MGYESVNVDVEVMFRPKKSHVCRVLDRMQCGFTQSTLSMPGGILICIFLCEFVSCGSPVLADLRLQIADMHYGNGAKTPCLDLTPKELRTCSDVNTTLFIQRLLSSEKPDLVVFTGAFGWVSLESIIEIIAISYLLCKFSRLCVT